jgi:uncharacterized protein involved in exopolysaccharide biosynthesis
LNAGRHDRAQDSRGERVVLVMADQGAPVRDGDISLRELFLDVWVRKWLVAAILTACLGISIAYALLATQWYSSDVIFVPAKQSGAGVSSSLGGLASIAGLAGIDLESDTSLQPLAVLASREFTGSFIEDLDLLPVLFHEKWDSSAGKWLGPPGEWPDLRDALRLFERRIRQVAEDKKRGVIVLTVTWTDPVVAAEWANLMVERVNSRMRAEALADSSRNIEYLNKELRGASVVALQQSIARLMENEMQRMMAARGNGEYAFKVIDKAVPAKWRSSPKRRQVVVLGGLSGLIFGVAAALLLGAMRRSRH